MNETVNDLRPRLMSVAYRMLGNVADAEDVVQDAFLRLHAADNVTAPEGFLVRATVRCGIDRIRSQRRRDKFDRARISEPVDFTGSLEKITHSESLGHAFLFMLERLAPSEMAAYVMRTAFDDDYSTIAEALEKSECHVRQIFRRANLRLLHSKPRFVADSGEAHELADQFVIACRAGDIGSIRQLLRKGTAGTMGGAGRMRSARSAIAARCRGTHLRAKARHSQRPVSTVESALGDPRLRV
jgi:RNA polymerase sigma-70 factor (ECF subfamily)